MTMYMKNRNCPCPRCRAKGLMGAAIIITVGILFLIQNFSSFDFGQTWPVLLIVVGVFVYLTRTASLEGHVPPYYAVGPVAPPPPGQTPPPPQSDSQVNP